jgi:hypothetical protein
MNFKLISIENPTPNKHEYRVEYSLDEQVKTATLIEGYNIKEEKAEYKVILDERISNGEFEDFVKNFIILAFQEKL